MVRKEDVEFWSQQFGRPLTETEVEEIKCNLKTFAEWLIESYANLRKRGLIDDEGYFFEKRSEIST